MILEYPLNIKYEPHVHVIAKKYTPPSTDRSESTIPPGDILGHSYFYIPQGIGQQVGATWNAESISATSQEIVGAVGAGLKNADKDTFKSIGVALSSDLFRLKDALLPGGAAKNLGYAKGLLLRPNDVLVIDSIGRYSISLTLELVPQSPEEGYNVRQIIKKFREWAQPTLSNEGIKMWLDYPPIFDINVKSTYSSTRAADSMDKDSRSNFFYYQNMVLESFDLAFSGGTHETLFYEDGTPIHATLKLDFKSLRPGWNITDEPKK